MDLSSKYYKMDLKSLSVACCVVSVALVQFLNTLSCGYLWKLVLIPSKANGRVPVAASPVVPIYLSGGTYCWYHQKDKCISSAGTIWL